MFDDFYLYFEKTSKNSFSANKHKNIIILYYKYYYYPKNFPPDQDGANKKN